MHAEGGVTHPRATHVDPFYLEPPPVRPRRRQRDVGGDLLLARRACGLLRRVRRWMAPQGPAGAVRPRQVVAGDRVRLGERLHGRLDEARVVGALAQHVY